jgi:hypothetical protein
MRRPFAFALALLGIVLMAGAAGAEERVIAVHVGDRLARFERLQPGVHRYMRYVVEPGGARRPIDIWTREIRFSDEGGAARMRITQRWDEVADKAVLVQDSLFEPQTFTPLTHVRRLERDGKTTVRGYRFTPGKVVGMADLADNDRKTFDKPMPEPSFNFEYDMELLQALPLAQGRTFSLPFYDAGIDEPGRYLFKVAGSGRIAGPDGQLVDCWKVTADYNTGKVVSAFWLAKASQLMIREDQPQPDGRLQIKTLLPPEPEDPPSADRRRG